MTTYYHVEPSPHDRPSPKIEVIDKSIAIAYSSAMPDRATWDFLQQKIYHQFNLMSWLYENDPGIPLERREIFFHERHIACLLDKKIPIPTPATWRYH